MKWIEDIRRFLRDLDYYSIKRPSTMWSRMLVRNLWVTLCLGIIFSISMRLLAKPPASPFVWWEIIRNALLSWPFFYIGGLCVIGVLRALRILKNTNTQRSQNLRQERRSQGLCPHCKYSLQGNRFAVRCPECGKLLYS